MSEKGTPLFTITTHFYEDGTLDFTTGGNEKATPSVSNTKKILFAAIVSKFFNALLTSEAMQAVYSLVHQEDEDDEDDNEEEPIEP